MAAGASLEENLAQLNEIIAKMEEEIPLEESFQLYNQGMKLVKSCNSKIDRIEKKVIVVNGETYDEPDE